MKIHSVVDAITNSSSEAFIYPKKNSISKAQELMCTIFKSSGISEPASNYFNFFIEINYNILTDCLYEAYELLMDNDANDYYSNAKDSLNNLTKFFTKIGYEYKGNKKSELKNKLESALLDTEKLMNLIQEVGNQENYAYNMSAFKLNIQSKTDPEINISSIFLNIFNIEVSGY
jgi:hypothetical protein